MGVRKIKVLAPCLTEHMNLDELLHFSEPLLLYGKDENSKTYF